MQKKLSYRSFIIIFSVLTLLCFGLCVIAIIRFSHVKMLLSLLPLAADAAVFRMLQDRYYKDGYFSDAQAVRFYALCQEKGIRSVCHKNFEDAAAVYRDTVSRIALEDNKKSYALMNGIYARGKKIENEKEAKEL